MIPTHSLRLKLILTFLAVSVAGTLIAALIVSLSNKRAFDKLLVQQGQSIFAQDVLSYYQTNGSWQGINQSLSQRPAPEGHDENPPPYALADSNGRIIIPNGHYLPGNKVPQPEMDRGTPVELDGRHIATILTLDQAAPRSEQEEAFVAQTNKALLIGGLSATAVAILLAIILARTLTRPLQELARASRQMTQGHLQQAVPVRTQDELGELAATFNQMSAELARANQGRRQMTADIAHDLRTPLTVLAGYLEAMADGTLAATPARLALMQQEVQTLQRLVTDLRTLSLADTGNLALHKAPTAIPDLLAQVHDAFAHQAAQQEITLHVEVDATLPDVSLDADRMRQALSNLVSNALRHTPAQGKITLAAAMTHDGLQIAVSDTGPGIPADDLPYIFNRFYRGDKARSEDSGGSGLGLAIVKSLVVAHGGTISAASPIANNQGTRFTITLPL